MYIAGIHTLGVHFDSAPVTPEMLKFANLAAQHGADQELKQCGDWVCENVPLFPNGDHPKQLLLDTRRPNPPSLKKEALSDLVELMTIARESGVFNFPDNILRALESLPDD
jgi:hypothetical protein